MSDPRLEGFARLLAEADSPEQFSALVARAKLMAAQEIPDAVLEAPIRTLGQYLSDPIEMPPELISPYLLVRGSILCTVGRAGKGKTQVNLNRILCLAAGKPLFADLTDKEGNALLAPPEPLKVLIIENEGAAGMFHKQIGIMVNAEGYLSKPDRERVLDNVMIWGDGGYSGLKLDDEAKVNMVKAGVEKHQPDIVFIEPFRGLWKGDENSSTDMGVIADVLSEIATQYNCGIILTHHEKKGGSNGDDQMSAARGSTVLEGHVATMEHFQEAKGGEFRELTYSKIRYGGGTPMPPVRMEWKPSAFWYDFIPTDALSQSILDLLAEQPGDALSTTEICEELNEKPDRVRKACEGLKAEGRIAKMASQYTGNGSTGNRWRLVNMDDTSSGGIDI